MCLPVNVSDAFKRVRRYLRLCSNQFYDVDTHNLLEEYRNRPEEVYHECTEQDH